MQTTKDKFERLLLAMLEGMVEEIMHNMANGHLESHSDYKFLAGRVRGLRAAIDAISEVNSIIERG